MFSLSFRRHAALSPDQEASCSLHQRGIVVLWEWQCILEACWLACEVHDPLTTITGPWQPKHLGKAQGLRSYTNTMLVCRALSDPQRTWCAWIRTTSY